MCEYRSELLNNFETKCFEFKETQMIPFNILTGFFFISAIFILCMTFLNFKMVFPFQTYQSLIKRIKNIQISKIIPCGLNEII